MRGSTLLRSAELYGLLMLAACLMAGPIATTCDAALPASETLLPATTRLFAAIRNIEASRAAIEKTKLSKIDEDPEVRPFIDDLTKQIDARMAEAAATTRTIALVRPPDGRGVGVFRISDGKQSQFYTFRELPCEIGGRGFAVHRLGQGNLYHVRVGVPGDQTCECMGFLRWDHCKHVAGLNALIAQGKLAAESPPVATGGLSPD